MRTLIAILLCIVLLGPSVPVFAAETQRTKHKPVVLKKIEQKKSKTLYWVLGGLGALAAVGLVAVAAGGGGGGGGGGGSGSDTGDASVTVPALPNN